METRSLKQRLHVAAPYVIIGQFVLDVVFVVLFLWVLGNQAQFTDYLNGRGELRTQQQKESHEQFCKLIASLEDDINGSLETLRKEANCPISPVPNGENSTPTTENAPGSFGSQPDDSVPIVGGSDTSTSTPTPRSQAPTGVPGGAPQGTDSPGGGAAPTAPQAPETTPPPPPAPGSGDRGGLVDGADVCLPFVGCVV